MILEKSLLKFSTRTSFKQLNLLIHDDFIEFGASGKIYNKQDILNYLPNEKKRKFEMSAINYKILSKNTTLIIYNLVENLLQNDTDLYK